MQAPLLNLQPICTQSFFALKLLDVSGPGHRCAVRARAASRPSPALATRRYRACHWAWPARPARPARLAGGGSPSTQHVRVGPPLPQAEVSPRPSAAGLQIHRGRTAAKIPSRAGGPGAAASPTPGRPSHRNPGPGPCRSRRARSCVCGYRAVTSLRRLGWGGGWVGG